jgi:hypothetical protein
MKCVCGHSKGVHMHTNNLASCAMCECKSYKQAGDRGQLSEALFPSKAPPPKGLAMNLQLLDGLVGQYALAHPNQEISRVTLIEFALWYQEKIGKR